MVYCTQNLECKRPLPFYKKTSSFLRCVVVKLGQFYEVLITRSSKGSKFTTKHLSNEKVFGKTANDFLTSKVTLEYIGRRNVHIFAIICRGKATKI
jgi:hypothetical protein